MEALLTICVLLAVVTLMILVATPMATAIAVTVVSQLAIDLIRRGKATR